jgi:tetratricopeptide (TPR) repeat protein
MRVTWAAILSPFVVVAAVACSSAMPRSQEVELEPTHVVVLDAGSGEAVVGDEAAVFKEAVRRYNLADYGASLKLYNLLLATHPGSRWLDVYHYDRGVLFLAIEDWRSSLADFRRTEQLAEREEDRLDALAQQAASLAGMERWEEAACLLDQVAAARVTPAQKVEAGTRAGMMWQKAHRYREAEKRYRAALDLYAGNPDLVLKHNPQYAALAQYQVGDLYAELFDQLEFRLPLERMRQDLEDKSALFLKAQNAFLKTIRLHHAYWALAAGYRIGALYEAFHQDLLEAQVPDDLDEEEVQVYQEELKRHIGPLMQRAKEVYRKNLELGTRVGTDNEWLQRTEEALRKLERLLDPDHAAASSLPLTTP